jgi:hypothetical protein
MAEAFSTASAGAAPLDDVMLAMDVVDTLRHADTVVERELSSEERDRQLKERLRQIYAAQGIDVPERILDEGVQGLKENRFVYEPPRPGLRRWLALLWVRRGRWGKWLAIGILALCLAGAGYYVGVKLPEERRLAQEETELSVLLPQTLDAELNRVRTVAKDPRAIDEAESLFKKGQAAVAAGDRKAARYATQELTSLRERLESTYVIRIIARPGQQSGVFRIPDANPNARNYYLIVEAIDADGRTVSVPVTSEEDGSTTSVTTWGIRVDDRTFAHVRADKEDDGIIQKNRVGEKRRGYLEPDYTIPVPGGSILAW